MDVKLNLMLIRLNTLNMCCIGYQAFPFGVGNCLSLWSLALIDLVKR